MMETSNSEDEGNLSDSIVFSGVSTRQKKHMKKAMMREFMSKFFNEKLSMSSTVTPCKKSIKFMDDVKDVTYLSDNSDNSILGYDVKEVFRGNITLSPDGKRKHSAIVPPSISNDKSSGVVLNISSPISKIDLVNSDIHDSPPVQFESNIDTDLKSEEVRK